MRNSGNKVLAVPGVAAEQAGAISYWTMQVGDGVLYDTLVAQWLAAGLPAETLPATTSPAAALREAVHSVEDKRLFASVTPERDGWVLTNETARKDSEIPLDFTVQAVVRLDSHGVLTLHGDPVLGERVRVEYLRRRDFVAGARLGGWLVSRAAAHGAVALRDTGGVYFVPRASVPAWTAEAKAIRNLGAVVFQIPALRGDDAIEAVTTALAAEADAEIAKMEADIAGGKLGERALKGRQDACAALLKKVRLYEGACEVSLAKLAERVERLAADVALAALADPNGIFAAV